MYQQIYTYIRYNNSSYSLSSRYYAHYVTGDMLPEIQFRLLDSVKLNSFSNIFFLCWRWLWPEKCHDVYNNRCEGRRGCLLVLSEPCLVKACGVWTASDNSILLYGSPSNPCQHISTFQRLKLIFTSGKNVFIQQGYYPLTSFPHIRTQEGCNSLLSSSLE